MGPITRGPPEYKQRADLASRKCMKRDMKCTSSDVLASGQADNQLIEACGCIFIIYYRLPDAFLHIVRHSRCQSLTYRLERISHTGCPGFKNSRSRFHSTRPLSLPKISSPLLFLESSRVVSNKGGEKEKSFKVGRRTRERNLWARIWIRWPTPGIDFGYRCIEQCIRLYT